MCEITRVLCQAWRSRVGLLVSRSGTPENIHCGPINTRITPMFKLCPACATDLGRAISVKFEGLFLKRLKHKPGTGVTPASRT